MYGVRASTYPLFYPPCEMCGVGRYENLPPTKKNRLGNNQHPVLKIKRVICL